MQIILLGTGTPIFDPAREHSALLVRLTNDTLLFDAGRGVTSQMTKLGHLPQETDTIFLTHHHFDHIGGLGELLMTAWHNGREAPLDIFGPHGTSVIVDALLNRVFARDIAFAQFTDPGAGNIREIVRVTEITAGWSTRRGSWTVSAEQVEHGHSLGISQDDFPCLGYRLEAQEKVVGISGDTVACNGLDRLAHDADILVLCCYLAEAEITTPGFEQLARNVIASSGQAGKIAASNHVKKLVLTHFRPKSEEMMASLLEDVRKDFAGEVILGEDLLVIDM